MRKVVQRFDFKCEFCGAKARGEELPSGWGTIITGVTEWLTGYITTKDCDACALCYPVERKKRHVY